MYTSSRPKNYATRIKLTYSHLRKYLQYICVCNCCLTDVFVPNLYFHHLMLTIRYSQKKHTFTVTSMIVEMLYFPPEKVLGITEISNSTGHVISIYNEMTCYV